MKKVTLMVSDERLALVEELVKAIADMEIVEVKAVECIEEFQRKPPMERLDYALKGVIAEKGLLVNQYDYAWLYAAVQEGLLKGIDSFRSVDSFRQHLSNIGIKDIPSNSTISGRYGCFSGKYPYWTFSDSCDVTETQRRVNVVKRFLSLFLKGK